MGTFARTVAPTALLIVLATGCAQGQPAESPPAVASRPAALVPWFPPVAAPAGAPKRVVGPKLEGVAKQALSAAAEEESKALIAELRSRGPLGLAAILAADDGSERARAVIDRVAGQRDARASRLFWYTDLADAKRAAEVNGGRPILSLRLLGRLDEELSCANSRFFRTVLYANREVSDYLRSRFILHWSSERVAPKITIDFGDGRRLERTITGNSIHYVLDQQGRLVDAVPGLYGPKAFMGTLENAARTADEVGGLTALLRRSVLRGFHARRIDTIARAWTADLAFLGVTAPPPAREASPTTAAPTAAEALPIAMPKAAAEVPMVAALTSTTAEDLEQLTTQPVWTAIASRRASMAQLDGASRALMRSKRPGLDAATVAQRAERFQSLMSLDTVRNEYTLHRTIHRWLLSDLETYDMEKLNARVYTELFLTPRTDPWVGLASPDTYTAIDNDGLITP